MVGKGLKEMTFELRLKWWGDNHTKMWGTGRDIIKSLARPMKWSKAEVVNTNAYRQVSNLKKGTENISDRGENKYASPEKGASLKCHGAYNRSHMPINRLCLYFIKFAQDPHQTTADTVSYHLLTLAYDL